MNPGRREGLILGGVAAAAAALGGLAGALTLQSGSGAATLLSTRFPDLAGHPRSLAEWRGRPLLCNFWATWCVPCREEIPLLNAAQQQYGPQGLQVVGIGIDSAANILDYAKSVKIDYPVLTASTGAIDMMRKLGNKAAALPYTVMLDRHGTLRARKLGAYSQSELESVLASSLR